MQPRVPVTFVPAGETIWVEPGATLAEVARRAGVLLAVPCAGRGVCAGCGVRILAGELEPADEVETRTLKRSPSGVRLACRARVKGAVEVQPLFAAEGALPSPAMPTAGEIAEVSAAGSGVPVAAALVAGVDLGTTSVSALVMEASSGREVARSSVPNHQQTFGADVLTRLSAAQAGQGPRLQELAEESIHQAILSASQAGGVPTEAIARIVIAANSVMAAMLAGADVSSLAAHPFVPPESGGPLGGGSERLLGHGSHAEVVLVPPIAAFVGGDALAATIAAGLVDTDAPRLLVDIGTNAELVLARPEGLLVTSTAAGPAFEGAGVSCGGPAGAGAVDRVIIDGDTVQLQALGGSEPQWFSGAGLVSAIAALRRAGHIGADGLMSSDGLLEDRFGRDVEGVLGVTLSEDARAPINLSQLDVRILQLAKAAVRVGVESLLQHAGMRAGDLAEVLVAGAFGAALEPADLVELGVLPAAACERTRRIGNAALEGAAGMALDPRLLELAGRTAASATHVDLAADDAFGLAFLKAMEFSPYEG